MGNSIFENFLNGIDGQLLKMKINSAVDSLKKDNVKELEKRINKLDKEDLSKQLNEFDIERLKQLGINIQELKTRITAEDIEKLRQASGTENQELLNKALDIYKKL